MTTTSPTKTMHFTSPLEAKHFAAGIALAQRKLQGHHKPTIEELSAASVQSGREQILKRFGRETFKKMFGTEPPAPAATTKPITSTSTASTRKSYGTGRTLHRYACKNWLPTLA